MSQDHLDSCNLCQRLNLLKSGLAQFVSSYACLEPLFPVWLSLYSLSEDSEANGVVIMNFRNHILTG